MTDKEHIIPLKDIEPPPPAGKKKKLNDLTVFILIFLGLGAFFLSSSPSYLISLIPQTFTKSMLSGMYKDVVLDDNPARISQPQKYKKDTPLPVMGYKTGVCFSFPSTLKKENKSAIDIKRLEGAKYGKTIAEIIAIAEDKTEYILDTVTLNSTGVESIICQKLSQSNSLFPEAIEAVYIRPLRAFTPSRIIWVTTIDVY